MKEWQYAAYTMPQKEKRKAELVYQLDKALKAIIALKLEKVILFGPMSRDDIGSHSDIDLLVIWDADMPFLKRLDVFYSAIQPDVAMDILIYTPKEITKAAQVNTFIFKAIQEEVVLYEKRI